MNRNFIFRKQLFFYTLLFTTLSILAQDSNDGWKLSKSKDGIKVYTRIPEGSKFKEYLAETTVQASPEQLVKVLKDVDHYTDWMAHIKSARLIKEDGKDEFYVYSEISVPWPFNNRDEVTKTVVSKDESSGTYNIFIVMIPDMLPENKGVVRMPEGKGKWVIEPVKDGMTQIVNQFIGDPGGSIPSWVVNMFIVDGPYKTLEGLKEILGQGE